MHLEFFFIQIVILSPSFHPNYTFIGGVCLPELPVDSIYDTGNQGAEPKYHQSSECIPPENSFTCCEGVAI